MHAQMLAQCPVPMETQQTVQRFIPYPSPSHTALTLRMLSFAILWFLNRFLLLPVIMIGCPRVLASTSYTSGRLPGSPHPLALPPFRQYLLRAHRIPGSLLGSQPHWSKADVGLASGSFHSQGKGTSREPRCPTTPCVPCFTDTLGWQRYSVRPQSKPSLIRVSACLTLSNRQR